MVGTREKDRMAHSLNSVESAAAVATAFGAQVRRHREGRGITQARLAEIIGTGRRFIVDLEAGKASCQLGLALVVAEAVGMPVQAVLDAQAEQPDEPAFSTVSDTYDDLELPPEEDSDGQSPRIL